MALFLVVLIFKHQRLESTLKEISKRIKNDKLAFIKFKGSKELLFCASPHEEDEKTSKDWDKIFVNHIPHKRVESRLYKELSKLHRK